MNQSTNYNLKIYEGTDLFNPLTVENVNFNDLDSIIKGISDAAIGRATELLTGTVHALTRVDPDRDYFAFTATANFTAGDTFTLDGAQVSALTPDGQQLATGAYIIGSEVLVLVKGTLLTFILNPAKAPDADKLDGHDSSYFAKDSDMTQAQNDIDALSTKVGTAVLTTTAPDCSGAINELNAKLTVEDDVATTTTGTLGVAKVFKFGRVVIANIVYTPSSNRTSGNLLFTLPYKSVGNIPVDINGSKALVSANGYNMMVTTGQFNANTDYTFNLVYITE